MYVLGDEFDGYTAGASWEDARVGVGHASKWERVAVVTDHEWVRHVVGMFTWVVPGDVKTFPLRDEHRAVEWPAGD